LALLALYAFLAGIVTILSPCILPLLPILLAGSTGDGKLRPWGIVLGFLVSFSFFTMTLSAIVVFFQVPGDILRWIAGAFIIAFGLIMVIPALKEKFLIWASRFMPASTQNNPTQRQKGFWPGFFLGITLGLVWTPCAGPIMASVVTFAATQTLLWESAVLTLVYSLGTSIPMLLILLGGKAVIDKLDFLKRNSQKVQQIFGVLMLLTGVAVFAGWDRTVQTAILDAFPGYEQGLTSFEENEGVIRELERLENFQE
jgi:cytochrome c biogenesis protein CcdA